jgi:hypothetical protein
MTVIPQLTTEIGYQVLPHMRVFVGYDLLYWGGVLRAGDQIDTVVDPGNLPNPRQPAVGPHPVFVFNETNFWAQGVRLGTEFRY